MEFEFKFEPEVLFLLPLLALGAGECECGETHGVSLAFGWLFWSVSFLFGRDHK